MLCSPIDWQCEPAEDDLVVSSYLLVDFCDFFFRLVYMEFVFLDRQAQLKMFMYLVAIGKANI